MKMQLTFKESEKWIWEEIQKHSGKSNFIKDTLAAHIKAEKPTAKKSMVKGW